MIVRTPKTAGFARIDNALLQDAGLSWKARGVLAYLMSRPDDWQVSVGDLVRRGDLAKNAVYRILQELEAAGYVRRTRERDDGGAFIGYTYDVYESPALNPDVTISPFSGNGESPFPHFPHVENPFVEKRDTTNNREETNELKQQQAATSPFSGNGKNDVLLSFFGINQAGGDGGDDDGSAAAAAASPGRAGTAVSSSSSSPSPSPTADDGRAALVTALQGLGMTQAGAVAALEGAARHWPGEALETAVCGWIDAARNDPTVTNKPGFVRQALANGWQRPAAGLDLAAVETAVLALLTRHRGIDHILDAADVPDVVRALALHEGVRQAARQDARFFGNAIKAAVADVNGREREIIEEWRANTERRRRYDALREALPFDMADALAMRYAGAATADAQDQILTHYEQQRQQAKTAVLAGD